MALPLCFMQTGSSMVLLPIYPFRKQTPMRYEPQPQPRPQTQPQPQIQPRSQLQVLSPPLSSPSISVIPPPPVYQPPEKELPSYAPPVYTKFSDRDQQAVLKHNSPPSSTPSRPMPSSSAQAYSNQDPDVHERRNSMRGGKSCLPSFSIFAPLSYTANPALPKVPAPVPARAQEEPKANARKWCDSQEQEQERERQEKKEETAQFFCVNFWVGPSVSSGMYGPYFLF